MSPITWLIFSLSLVNFSSEFDAGFLKLLPWENKAKDSTHYSITVCALCRATIDYLKTTCRIDTTYLETRFNESNGQCANNIVSDIAYVLRSSTQCNVNPWQFSETVKRIASKNTEIDAIETFSEKSHFDSENFLLASQLLLTRYQATVNSISNDKNIHQARKTFGQLLHTLQDFYSHTNHIELDLTSPSTVLGQRIFREDEYAPISMRTCISCKSGDCQTTSNLDENFRNTKLYTSGYFIAIGFGIFEKGKPKGKCSHGGFVDSSSSDEPTGGINKDTLGSVHGHLHYQAATMAYRATVQILHQLQTDIGNDAFGLFLGIKKTLNSLVISIDTSYTMSEYIDLAKSLSIYITDQYSQFEYGPHNYILVAFDENQARLVINSPDADGLGNAIRTLKVSPQSNSSSGEMYYHSLNEGLKYAEFASIVYTFTDSPANDAYLKYQSRALLRNKRAVIYSFLSQHMQTWRYRTDFHLFDPLDGSDNETDLASISGGVTFPVFLPDQNVVIDYILRRIEWTRIQALVLVKTTSTLIEFFIDPSINEIYLDISSINKITNITQMELRRPDNSLYPLMDTYNNSKHLYSWKITELTSGAWHLKTADILGGLNYDVQIQGKTNIVCSSTLQKEMEPNTDTSGYTQLTTEPIIGSDLVVLTSCENLFITNATISLVNQSGNIIASYSPIQSDAFGTLTVVHIPQEQFRIQTIITLDNGTKIQRLEKQLISPTIFSIELTNQPYIVIKDQTMQMNYTIQSNLTEPVTLRLQIKDTMAYINTDDLGMNLTFINRTSGTQLFTLPADYDEKLRTNLVVFSVSIVDNQTKRFIYQNDDTVSVYMGIGSTSFSQTIIYLIISFLFLLYAQK